ncbi:MAG TPA: hypothetical protein ENI34_08055 [candidate division WOR-3 bacterium]|uniref:Uncharacterized protein n=1 Tax=candidate division WOR-3 bacterium TaxID=2052148 RepID=A0A9C9K0N1_UNCW3|nr:hypothetical protein [candidate division WOR-3 bacterium]
MNINYKNTDEVGDYIYRFELPADENCINSTGNLGDIIRGTILALLKVCKFTYKGEEVKIDGFRLLDNEKEHKLFL